MNRRVWYRQKYLQSKHWKIFSNNVRKQRNFKCEVCGMSPAYDVHHLNYRNLWHETYNDVQLLCRKCHDYEHLPLLVKFVLGLFHWIKSFFK